MMDTQYPKTYFRYLPRRQIQGSLSFTLPLGGENIFFFNIRNKTFNSICHILLEVDAQMLTVPKPNIIFYIPEILIK